MGVCLIWLFFGVATLIHPSTEQMMESDTNTLYLQNIIRLINNLSQEFTELNHKITTMGETLNGRVDKLNTKITLQEERLKEEMNESHRNMTMVNENLTMAVEELDVKITAQMEGVKENINELDVKITAQMEGVKENINDHHQNITDLVKSLNEKFDVKSEELLSRVKSEELLSRANCPEGYVKVEERCLLFRTTEATYRGSNQACLRKGGQLLKLDCRELFDSIVRFIKANGLNDNSFWVGIDDIDAEGDFRYLDGTSLEMNLWSAGEPNDAGKKEDCAHMAHNGEFLLNDLSCDRKIASICEYLY